MVSLYSTKFLRILTSFILIYLHAENLMMPSISVFAIFAKQQKMFSKNKK